MALIANLNEHGMLATACSANQPSDDRMVVVQFLVTGDRVATMSARYRKGVWISEAQGWPLIEVLTVNANAIWFESPLFTPTCCATQ